MLVAWVTAQSMQVDSPIPVFHEVTLTDLGTGLVLRRSNVSSTEGVHQQRQLLDNLLPGSYLITVMAGNVFGRSRSLSQNFDIMGAHVHTHMS